MSAIEKPVLPTTPVKAPSSTGNAQTENARALHAKTHWQRIATPVLVLLRAAGLVATITRNWNAWEG